MTQCEAAHKIKDAAASLLATIASLNDVAVRTPIKAKHFRKLTRTQKSLASLGLELIFLSATLNAKG